MPNADRDDLRARYAHSVGSFGNFLVSFGGYGQFKVKIRQSFNDIFIFDSIKRDYIKFKADEKIEVTLVE